ncbi:MAG: right-handed parallel beta-helix repeat-containing protein [Rikenellaceae bacterium]
MKKILFLTLACCISLIGAAQQHIKISHTEGDATPAIRQALEQATEKDIVIELESGEYFCRPDYAFEKYCAVTNHGNGLKKILFPMIGLNSVTIKGDNTKLTFHGQMMPFLFEDCGAVKVSGVTINWDIPFTFLAEVMAVNPEEGWREVKPMTEGFSWELKNGKILFPNIDGFNYEVLGSTLPFTKDEKRVVKGAIDTYSNPTRVEKLANGNLRIYEKARYYPPVGSMLSSKGDREHDRYAPAFEVKDCKNVELDDITIHHALGMGFLFERSEDIKITNSQIVVEEGSPRVIASTADATHFANCRGDILIEGCTFENMLDDGTNVHGTYVVIDKVIDPTNIIVELQHFEQLGFEFAAAGDQVWFIKQPSPDRMSEVNEVTKAVMLNEQYTQLTFAEPLPENIGEGDLVENKTWNPTFTMRGCTIQNHRARCIVLKTPGKTLIENNYFSGMMTAVLFRGESFFWYESGQVEDVLIQHNTFHNAADCGTSHSVMSVTPKLGAGFDDSALYDRNIRFVGNKIETANPKIVFADRVLGLLVKDNHIVVNSDQPTAFPDEPTFELINCKDARIEGNRYIGAERDNHLEADEVSRETLTIKKNKGLEIK